jgi:hypothetical protein
MPTFQVSQDIYEFDQLDIDLEDRCDGPGAFAQRQRCKSKDRSTGHSRYIVQ